jgi:hypothetical protein
VLVSGTGEAASGGPAAALSPVLEIGKGALSGRKAYLGAGHEFGCPLASPKTSLTQIEQKIF